MFIYVILIFMLLILLFRLIPILLRYRAKQNLSAHFLLIAVLISIITIVTNPTETVEAAYSGLVVWSTIVIPALLPFFIGSELLINLGFVKFIGVLLEPMMRPVFNVPGEGSFAFAMSITSGYPIGAKIISNLRANNEITSIEAQRLISFCSTSGPLFMIGSVAVGMFHSPEIGIIIAISHYLGAIIVGILFRFYKISRNESMHPKYGGPLLKKAFKQLHGDKRSKDSIGIILANAVKNSINTLVMVGGFIVLFAVFIRVLELLNIITFLSSVISTFIFQSKIPSYTVSSFLTGIFEVTMGAKMITDNAQIALSSKVLLTSFIIAWSGFSIHAQVSSIIGSTDIKYSLYLLAKTLHAIFSSLIAYIIYPFFSEYIYPVSTVYNSYQNTSIARNFFLNCKLSIELFFSVFIVLLIGCLISSYLLKFRNILRGMK